MSIVEKAADQLRRPQHAKTPHSGRDRDARRMGAPDSSVTQPRPGANDTTRSHVIDFSALRRSGLLPSQSMAPQLTREYQRIKRPLLTGLRGNAQTPGIRHGNRVMLASAASGEGKSFTAFNLALSLARERDHSVVLVDGDVLKPGITQALGLTDQVGLVDLLAHEDLTPEDVILPTDIPDFSVLAAGRGRDDMAELLSSRRMGRVVEALSVDPSTIVIFDSSPLLATAESQAIASHMGQILVVVKAGTTERRAVQSALSLVDFPDCSVSLVLNQSHKAHGDDYAAYYGMYYGNDHDRA